VVPTLQSGYYPTLVPTHGSSYLGRAKGEGKGELLLRNASLLKHYAM